MAVPRPKVSVLIPVYNAEKYLARALDSALTQSIDDLEVLCVNDASTDSSVEILKGYADKDPRVKVIDKPCNEGSMMARKSAYEAALGEYFFFLDADDYLLPDALRDLYNAGVAADADVVVSDYLIERSNGLRTYSSKTATLTDDTPDSFRMFIASGKSNTLWSILYRRDLFDGKNYETFMHQTFSEDRMLLIQLISNVRKTALLRKPSMVYFLNDSSVTHKRMSDERVASMVKALRWSVDYLEPAPEYHEAALVHYLRTLSFLIESGYPADVICQAIPENRSLLSFASLKRMLGLRLAVHTRLSISSSLYRKSAARARLLIRRIIKKY